MPFASNKPICSCHFRLHLAFIHATLSFSAFYKLHAKLAYLQPTDLFITFSNLPENVKATNNGFTSASIAANALKKDDVITIKVVFGKSKVVFEGDVKVHAKTTDDSHTPLIWEKSYGKGKFVVDNLGIYERNVRGIYAASYSLLTEATVYPVINGSTYYIDDFPSPVPAGDGRFVKRDYDMSVSEFYTNVWWPDLLKLHEKYGIVHTGVVIENYEAQTDGKIVQQNDLDRFKYFGNSLLANGGELGYHGYNHQPLSPSSVSLRLANNMLSSILFRPSVTKGSSTLSVTLVFFTIILRLWII